jgi:hypothetical protein
MRMAVIYTVFLLLVIAVACNLMAIPAQWALNMPSGLECSYYISSKRGWGCFSIELQHLSFFIIALCIPWVIYAKRIFFPMGYLKILSIPILLSFMGAFCIRAVYYWQGHAKTPYILWSIPLAIVVAIIWYKADKDKKNNPVVKQAALIKQRIESAQEVERMEIEIEERKRELGKKA